MKIGKTAISPVKVKAVKEATGPVVANFEITPAPYLS